VRTQAGSRGGTSRPAPRTRRPAHQPRQCRLLRAPVHVFVATDPDCTPSIGNARCSAPAGGKCRPGRPALQRAPPAHAGWFARGTSRPAPRSRRPAHEHRQRGLLLASGLHMRRPAASPRNTPPAHAGSVSR